MPCFMSGHDNILSLIESQHQINHNPRSCLLTEQSYWFDTLIYLNHTNTLNEMNPEHLNEELGESFTCVLLLMGRLSCFRDNWLYYKGVLR